MIRAKFFYIIICLLVLVSCKKDINSLKEYHKGELTIITDDSFNSVITALAEGYMIQYPETNVNVEIQKEDIALMDLLKRNSKITVMSRELEKNEIEEYERVLDLKYRPDKFAADAVVFVTSKNSSIESLSIEEIKKGLIDDKKPFIFDGTNSSNLNFVSQKLGLKPSDLKFSIINGNTNLMEEIGKYPEKIGVVSLNTFSRPYSKQSTDLKSKVKILPLVADNQFYTPDVQNLMTMKYPFTRILYFLTSEANFNIANAFIRYSCSPTGQMIIQKEGLQKYYLYKREVKMN